MSRRDTLRYTTDNKRSEQPETLSIPDTTSSETENLYTERSLRDIVIEVNENSQLLKHLGYDWIDVDTHTTTKVTSYDGYAIAVPIIVQLKKDASQKRGWVTLDIQSDGIACYKDSISGQTLKRLELPQSGDISVFLENSSRTSKVVKSRQMWMYPKLFDVPPEEVWPRDKSVMVIGDPFQTCDRENCTIVEYEYADEMLPPVLPYIIGNESNSSRLQNQVVRWLRNLFEEDLRAFDRLYSMFTPQQENPYQAFIYKCFSLVAEISTRTAENKPIEDLEREYEELKKLGSNLIDGSWSIDEGRDILQLKSDEEGKDLYTFFTYKQLSLENNGNPKAWKDFTTLWEGYLQKLPSDYLSQRVSDFDKKKDQVRHWLKTLPTTTSPQRIMEGVRYLERFFWEIYSFYDLDKTEISSIEDHNIMHGFDRNEGQFGFFLPGHSISLRHKKALTEGLLRIEQMIMYHKGLLPHLLKEKQRIEEAAIQLSDPTRLMYFHSLEQAWAKQHFFHKHTQRAVPIHGFFPYKMPAVPEQDRIIALTSVTMHGWNYLNRDEFEKEITASLSFLKVGGKYILGPINQSVYYGKPNDTFDANALVSALHALANKGLISFEFKKGKSEHHTDNPWSDVYEEDSVVYNPDNQLLLPNESAHSLIITRLQ